MFMGPPIGCKKDGACIYHSIFSCPGPINCKSNSRPINGEKSCVVHHQYWLYYAHLFFSRFRLIMQMVVQLPENGREKSANSERFSWARNGGKLLKSLLKPIPMLMSPPIGCKKDGACIYHSNTFLSRTKLTARAIHAQ